MDWKQIISHSADQLESDDKKDEIFEELVFLENFQNIDGKGYKKLFKLSQFILKFKGEQVVSLLTELDTLATKQGEQEALGNLDGKPLNDELIRLKKNVEKLEADKSQHKIKIKELTEEILFLQKKQEVQYDSDKDDSPDQLSEIDRQNELLNNISMKNKHIKRLLRDIENLEKQNTDQIDTINTLRSNFSNATLNSAELTHKFNESQDIIKEQKTIVESLNIKIKDLEEQIENLQDLSKKREEEIDVFAKQLEERACLWKNILDEKQEQLDTLQEKYDEILERNPGYDIDSERQEIKRLGEEIQERDQIIQKLENKLYEVSREMVSSTNAMNKLSAVKENAKKNIKTTSENCCENLKNLLEKSNARCKEYQEMLTNIEEDNILKSKQAVDAIQTLHSYQSGEKGLSHALKKITELEQKVNSRNKQIRALVMELNTANDYANENSVLRKRLGIPEDETVSSKSLMAKQRKLQKMNERLTLKLRASEEMRLQLKLKKTELKRQILSFNTQKLKINDNDKVNLTAADTTTELPTLETKFCENCFGQYNQFESNKYCNACVAKQNCNLCENCQQKLKVNFNQDTDKSKENIKDLEKNYTLVVEENENLRIGMHEILHKLREYDAMSSHITIDTTTLEKVLHALDARSISGWYHPAMRIQNELMVSKERELALRERIRISEDFAMNSKINSTVQQTENEKNENFTIELNLDEFLNQSASVADDASTNKLKSFDSPNKNERKHSSDVDNNEMMNVLKQNLIDLKQQLNEKSSENEELKIYKTEYNNLIIATNTSDDDEKKKYLLQSSVELTNKKIELNREKSKCEYMLNEQENLNKLIKQLKYENIDRHSEYKKELNEYNKKIELLQVDKKNLQKTNNDFVERKDFQNIQNELFLVKSELGNLVSGFFKNIHTFDSENIVKLDLDKIVNIAVIQDNLATNFITISEFNEITRNVKTLQEELDKTLIKCRHLEKVLKISEEQITSQQQILSKFSDEEISLRHLIVDLQSQSNEKYIIAKSYREIEILKLSEEKNKIEIEKLTKEINNLKMEKEEIIKTNSENRKEFDSINKNNNLKIKYLTKALMDLHQRYCKFTPLYPLFDFIKNYSKILQLRETINKTFNEKIKQDENNKLQEILEKFKEENNSGNQQNEIHNKLEIVKYQTQNEYLHNQVNTSDEKLKSLQKEIDNLKLKEISLTQHWRAIEMIFSNENNGNKNKVTFAEKGIQMIIEKTDKSTATDESHETPDDIIKTVEIQKSLNVNSETSTLNDKIQSNKCLESQLKQAMILASTRSTLLLETENKLTESQGRIKAIERILEEKEKTLKEERQKNLLDEGHKEDNILVVTISSLQKLISEKDANLLKFQELLKAERIENTKTFDTNQKDIKSLKDNINDLESKLREKEKEISTMENEKSMQILLGNNSKVIKDTNKDTNTTETVHEKNDHQTLMEISDNYIENMFLDEKQEFELEDKTLELQEMTIKLNNYEDEIQRLQLQLRDVSNREKIWEKNLSDKDNEIDMLHDKLNTTHIERRDISENVINRRDIEQLRDMLEEKDRHIQDLTDTLTHFHDDQQKFINDTSLHSAEQVAQLSSDINIREATNRVLNTQIEALKRQITNLSQREKQARELVKTLKNQLIRRPVISVKPERTISTREEHLQRKVHLLETEISETKEELRRQTSLAENRKSKNAIDLDLWNKQKHWQQSSEKLKIKLKERENEVEKVRASLTIAKNTISRLEREKHLLEGRNRNNHYCSSASCPNIHTNKYTLAESPESYVTNSDDYGHHEPVQISSTHNNKKEYLESHPEMMEALKMKVESQQRKIVAMELEGKGSNALSTEFERLQERLTSLEAQNLRLEAKNLQIQLDNDMMRQVDDGERTKRQIKHLEEYIIVLKDELSQALSLNVMTSTTAENICKNCSLPHGKPSSSSSASQSQMEQTILALRRVVERLKVDNKNLRDGKGYGGRSTTVAKEIYDKLKSDFEKVQKTYSEALDKISSLQIEVDVQTVTCSNCKERIDINIGHHQKTADELREVKEKLNQKTQLLEKAKILLTRAAAKEKHLREQIDFWKRRCSELQNVPVIDEE